MEPSFDLTEALKFPRIVNVNVMNGKCMCKCDHCPLGQTSEASRPERFPYAEMNLDLYCGITDQISNSATNSVLRLHSVGEPLYWPHLVEATAYSRIKGVTTWLFTCAVTKDRNLLRHICDNIDIIEVSINSSTRKDYLRTKGIDAFQTVQENLAYMSDYIEASHSGTRLLISRVQSEHKETDRQFVKFWKDSGMAADVFVRSYHTYNNILPGLDGARELSKKTPCLVHWARFNVDTNGDVYICFNELFKERKNASHILGNLINRSIKEIWCGPKLNKLRSAELSGDYSKLTFCDVLVCKHCKTFQPFNGVRDTSEKQIMTI